MKNILPIILCGIDFVQAIICLWQKDLPRCIYWCAAGALTWTTMLIWKNYLEKFSWNKILKQLLSNNVPKQKG